MISQSMAFPKPIPVKFDWLFSKRIDFLFFYGSIFAGILCYCLLQTFQQKNSFLMMVLIANVFGAGPLHLGATAFPYFDKKNLHYFWDNLRRRKIFFYAPPLIFALTVIGSLIYFPVVAFIYLVWTIQHLVQQNVGILLLYHRADKGEALANRTVEARSQQFTALFFSLMFFQRVIMNNAPFIVMDIFKAIALIAALVAISMYLGNLYKQVHMGKYINLPAFCFWIFSVFCLAPIAFLGQDYSSAFVIPLSAHWFQYLALNTVLVKRKYASHSGQLQNLPVLNPLLLFAGTCLVVCLMVLACTFLSTLFTTKTIMGTILGGLVAAFGITHYFLDAFLWRFRDPFLRETVLPFLKKQAQPLATAQ